MKTQLQTLCDALDVSRQRIKRGDENKFLAGKHGSVHVDSDHWYINLTPRSDKHHAGLKRQLGFMVPVDNSFVLKRMPTEGEATTIRKLIGLPKRRKLTPDQKIEVAKRLNLKKAA